MPDQPNNAFSKVVDFLESRRKQQQDIEDKQIDAKITLIHDLISAPGANPARTAEGLSNLMDLYNAKGGKTKPKKGAGPWGEHETPEPSLLAGIIHGTIPFEGPTTEAVPRPQSPAEQGLMPEGATFLPGLKNSDGSSVLNTSVMVPPEPLQSAPDTTRMLGAARDMQKYNEGPKVVPVANQPMMRSSEEIAREQGTNKGIEASAVDMASADTDFNIIRDQAIKAGMDPAEASRRAADAVAYKRGLKTPTMPKALAGKHVYEYTDQTGHHRVDAVIYTMPDGSTQARSAITGMALPPDAQEVPNSSATGSAFQQHMIQRPDGTWVVSYAPKDPTSGTGTSFLTTGITGKLPPPPTFVYDTVNDAGQTVPVVAPKTPTVGGKGAPGGLPPKAQKLGTEEQTFIDSAQGIQKTMDRINSAIEGAHLESANSMSDWASTQAQNWIRKQGFEPKQFQADLQQRTGYIRATLLRSLLGGRPNKYVTEIFQSHLPAEFQTPAQIHNTLRLIRQEIQDRYDGISQGHAGQALPALGGATPNTGGANPVDKRIEDYFRGK